MARNCLQQLSDFLWNHPSANQPTSQDARKVDGVFVSATGSSKLRLTPNERNGELRRPLLMESPPSSPRHSQDNLHESRLHSLSDPAPIESNRGSGRGLQAAATGMHTEQHPGTVSSSFTLGSFNSEDAESSKSFHPPQRSDSGSALCAALFKARHEWPPRMNSYFIPNDELERLLHVDAIMDELGLMPTQESHRLAQNVSNKAPRLFAILVCLGLGELIPQFIDEGIDDGDLPFGRTDDSRRPRSWQLCSKSRPNEPIKCMAGWKQSIIVNFDREQRYVLAHIFDNKEEGRIPHYDIGNNCILPFVKDEEQGNQVKQGGFSTVWEIIIHPAHQRLHCSTNSEKSSPSMALKRLHSTEEEDFLSEVAMFEAFTDHDHPHLVRLLATYRYRNRYYLLFPFAKLNLRNYWESKPLPDFTESMILWSLHQCKAIASGLHLIHTRQTTQRLADWGIASAGNGSLAGVEDATREFGRHGDIKPENILWSMEIDEIHADRCKCIFERGYLLIADFGLMEFHRRLTRSKVLAQKIGGSQTYGPPEMGLNKEISRAYDIWSLGCLYLEFIIWMVLGWEALSEFSKARGMTGASGVTDDTSIPLCKMCMAALLRTALSAKV
ncbi:Serine/threonine-protein kinase [Lachnellula occidentalis]|uniref:Serine/threonine-protein kinase n=1 Tax=Lachnellula occidentalis TaxID=215460 RepID=A0A8H8UJP8_9HELO|nr:Serine/threonine-protein kinase [Lachnellula occidentalis]